MRDTPLVEVLVLGGLSQRQAACLERWLADKMPAGITPERLRSVVDRVFVVESARLATELVACKRRIAELEYDVSVSSPVQFWNH